MNDNVLVSIIINNFNYEKFLSKSIESAIYQSYKNIEVIVVDDGSTDFSRKIIKDCAAQYNLSTVFKSNGGQASAFNEGFLKSSGEIVIFLDSDDILDSKIVEKLVSLYKPSISKLQYSLVYVDADENSLHEYVPRLNVPNFDAKYLMQKYGSYPSPPTSGNAWSRNFLEQILPLNENEWRISADSYLIAMAPFYGDVINVQTVGGMYRVHSENNFYNESLMDKSWLLRSIEVDLKKCRSLFEMDLISEDVLLNNISYLKNIVALKRLYPDFCPYTFSKINLVKKSLCAVCESPWLGAFAKLTHFFYFLFIFMVPVRIARNIVRLSIFPANRMRILKRWI